MASSHRNPSLDISISGTSLDLRPGLEVPFKDEHEPAILEHGPHFTTSPLDYLKRIGLFVSGSDWRGYDNYIGQRIFYNDFSDEIKDAVMASPQLRSKMQELVARRLHVEQQEEGLQGPEDCTRRREELLRQLEEVAWRQTDQMICKMDSKLSIRAACFLATQLLTRSYHQGIHVASEEVLRLRAVAEEAEKKNQSIIYLPRHTSHVDYVALQVICFRLGLSLPTVIAGDNLNIPILGPFLQHAGAMWIRRSFGDDQLYTTLVQSYIDVLLQKGLNVECFIEGGRSRTGKLLPPKFGILNFLLESVVSGRVQDAIICPVSTQYDKVIEVNSYVNELLGTPKKKENLAGFLSASSVLSLKLGRVDVRFHEPWSLREFVQQQNGRLNSLTDHQAFELEKAYSKDIRIRLLRTLGYRVLSDINAVSVVMPTALIGTVLLTSRGNGPSNNQGGVGIGKSELIRRVEWLAAQIRAQGGRVSHFAGLSTNAVVERGLEVLGPELVRVQRNLAEETCHVVDAFQLSFYRNMTIHIFISQALICAACYVDVKKRAIAGDHSEQKITLENLKERVAFLSQLFRGEFIFPTAGFMANLDDTLGGLQKDKVIQITHAPQQPNDPTTANSSHDHVLGTISLLSTAADTFNFYHSLISPFIETYWLASLSLLLLVRPDDNSDSCSEPQPATLPFSQLLNHSQLLGKTLHAQGLLSHFEAVNKETLKNAFGRFVLEGVVAMEKVIKGKRGGGEQTIRVQDEWLKIGKSGKRKVWAFCLKLAAYRVQQETGDWEAEQRLVELVRERMWKRGAGPGTVIQASL